MRIPRLSKRRQLRTMLVAALDRLEANQPYIQFPLRGGKMRISDHPGWCRVCGLTWEAGDLIDIGVWPDGAREWMHVKHPDLWQALRDNLEVDDGVLITWAGEGQGPQEGRLTVGLRRPQSRIDSGQHTDYIDWEEAKEKGIL